MSRRPVRPPGTPVQIIHCDSKRGVPLRLNKEALNRIFNQHNVRDREIVIFSLVGAYRTGKSFLLNLMLRYLYALEIGRADKWLEDTETPLSGFDWQTGVDRTTEGIIIWDRPFSLFSGSNQVALFLMDTQGLFDEKASPEQAYSLVTLSTLISSIQVYNITSNVDESHLKHLELFIEAGMMMMDIKQRFDFEAPFQRLIFLVRDWIGKKKYAYGTEGGEAYLNEKLKPRDDQAQQLKNVRQYIKACFEDVECFLMPHPGLHSTQQEACDSESDDDVEFTGQLCQIRKRFVERLPEVANFFFGKDRLRVKRCAGRPVLGSDMLKLFMRYVDLFAEGKVPKPSTTRQALLDHFNNMVIDDIMKRHGKQLLKEIERCRSFMQDGTLERKLAEEERKSRKRFDDSARGNDKEIAVPLSCLKDKIKDFEKLASAENAKKRLYYQEESRIICRRQLTTCKHHYRTQMDEYIASFKNDVEDQELSSKHKMLGRTAEETFNDATKNIDMEKIPFLTDLHHFLGESLQRYNDINESKRKRKIRDIQQSVLSVNAGKDLYTDEMDKVYSIGMEPTSENDLDSAHRKHKESALRLYRQMTQLVKFKPEEGEKEVSCYCDKFKKKYSKQNEGNRKWREESDQFCSGRGMWEARCVFRRGLEKECRLGSKHKNDDQMKQLFILHSRKAEQAYVEYTKSCFTPRVGWQGPLKQLLEQEFSDIKNMNMLNDGNFLPAQRKDLFR